MRRFRASIGLAAALDEVAAEAQWEARDLVARRGRARAPDLLLGRSAELACSAVGRDQLLSVALDRAAAALADGEAIPDLHLDAFLRPEALPDEDRASLRRQADELPAPRAGAPAERLARAYRENHRRAPEAPPLAQRLREDALLAETLWADARIPGDRDVRILMLASVPHLRARARASEADASWWRRATRRCAALLGRGGHRPDDLA